MSTISAASGAPHTSHKRAILDAIGARAKAGTVSSTDQTALDGAVDDIDTDLTSGSTTGSSSKTRLDPSQMKDRINTLIDAEVSNGKLTTDQASTLKDVFSKSGGQGGPGGPQGAGGPPPGGPAARRSGFREWGGCRGTRVLRDRNLIEIDERNDRVERRRSHHDFPEAVAGHAKLFDELLCDGVKRHLEGLESPAGQLRDLTTDRRRPPSRGSVTREP